MTLFLIESLSKVSYNSHKSCSCEKEQPVPYSVSLVKVNCSLHIIKHALTFGSDMAAELVHGQHVKGALVLVIETELVQMEKHFFIFSVQ